MSGEIEETNDVECELEIEEPWFITVCAFCKKNLTAKTEINISKLLQCLHAICNECYVSWNENDDKTCPECQMPSKKVEVRENKVLSEIVSDIEIPNTEGKVCNIHDALVTHWCENCAEFICEACVNHHGQLKSTREHKIKTKDEYLNSITVGEPKSVFPCTIHPQNQLTIVCHTCHAMTCRDCQLEFHRDHKYDFVADKIDETKIEVYNFFKKIEYHSIVLSAALDKVSVREKKLEELKRTLVKQITEVFNMALELVNKRCRELMVTAVAKANQKISECNTGRTELQKDLRSLKLCLTFVKSVLYKSSDSVIFYTKDLMLNHMEKIRTKSKVPNAADIINLKFVPENIADLKSGISNFGAISESPDLTGEENKHYMQSAFMALMTTYSEQLKGRRDTVQQPTIQTFWQQFKAEPQNKNNNHPQQVQHQSQQQHLQEQQQQQLEIQQQQQQKQLEIQQQQQKQLEIQQQQKQLEIQQQQKLQQQRKQLEIEIQKLQQHQQLLHQAQQQQQQQKQLDIQQQQKVQQQRKQLKIEIQKLQQQQQLLKQQQLLHQVQQQQQQQMQHQIQQQQQQIQQQQQQQIQHQMQQQQLKLQQPFYKSNQPSWQQNLSQITPYRQDRVSPGQQNNAQTKQSLHSTQNSISPSRQVQYSPKAALQSTVQSQNNSPHQTVSTNSCQQMMGVSPSQPQLQQQCFTPTTSHQNNGLNQKIGNQQTAVNQQQMSAQLYQFSAGPMPLGYRPNNVQQQQIVRTQASNQTQLTSMHSPSVRTISPLTSLLRARPAVRPGIQNCMPTNQSERMSTPHRDRVSILRHDRTSTLAELEQLSKYGHAHNQQMTEYHNRVPPPPYSFQIPLNKKGSQVAIVELKPVVQPQMNIFTQAPMKLWHIPETIQLPSNSNESSTDALNEIKKVRISPPQPHQSNQGSISHSMEIDSSESTANQITSPSQLHQLEKIKEHTPSLNQNSEVAIISSKSTKSMPLIKKEKDSEDYADVLSTLNELNKSLDKVDIANNRPSIEDREDSHEDWCAVCMDGGDLVCCDICPKAFHYGCHVPVITHDEVKGDWQCLLCKTVEPVENKDPASQCLSQTERKAACRLLLEIYCQYDASLNLRQPVPPENTAYYDIVRQPICLDQIRDKLTANRYRSMVEFVSDIKLMFNNFYLVNPLSILRASTFGIKMPSSGHFLASLCRKYSPSRWTTKPAKTAESQAVIQTKSLEDMFTYLLSRFLEDPSHNATCIKTEAMET